MVLILIIYWLGRYSILLGFTMSKKKAGGCIGTEVLIRIFDIIKPRRKKCVLNQ